MHKWVVFFVFSSLCADASILPAVTASGNIFMLKTATGSICAEDFLMADKDHDGSDYGAAINAAVRAQSLTEPSTVSICNSGDHKVFTPIVIDRPIMLQMTGSKIIPQSTLASPVSRIEGANLTAGSSVISVANTAGLRPGMSVGGIGVTSSTYISDVSPGKITLSLPASIVFNGIVSVKSATITGISAMGGLAVGQTLSGYGLESGTTITSIDPADHSVSLSRTAVAGSPVPASFMVGGTWTTGLMAVSSTPVIRWIYNRAALRNSEGQMVGGGMRDVWIESPGFRNLSGVQGVQIYGWDRFKVYDLQVENLAGSALILGGPVPNAAGSHATVRESYFFDTELRDDGDWTTGQPVLELMTGNVRGHAADEINQIGFSGGQLVFYYGEAITVGSFNSEAGPVDGPRLLWFTNNFQVEGGSHLEGPPIPAPVDAVHLIRAADVFFNGCEVAAPGFGKALFRIDNVNMLSIQNSLLYTPGKHQTFKVSTTNGSAIIPYMAGPPGVNSFDVTGAWDGVGIEINDGANCTPCNAYLAPRHAVSASGDKLTLMSPFPGRGTTTATLTIGIGGYYFNYTGTKMSKFVALGNQYVGVLPRELRLIGVPSENLTWNVGSGFLNSNGLLNINDFHAFNVSSGAAVSH